MAHHRARKGREEHQALSPVGRSHTDIPRHAHLWKLGWVAEVVEVVSVWSSITEVADEMEVVFSISLPSALLSPRVP